MKVCAQNPIQGEYTLCGDAFDAPDTENDVEPFRFAGRGDVVTCELCRKVIYEVRENFPRCYKMT